MCVVNDDSKEVNGADGVDDDCVVDVENGEDVEWMMTNDKEDDDDVDDDCVEDNDDQQVDDDDVDDFVNGNKENNDVDDDVDDNDYDINILLGAPVTRSGQHSYVG